LKLQAISQKPFSTQIKAHSCAGRFLKFSPPRQRKALGTGSILVEAWKTMENL
jgi:hypothetical protein